MIQVLVALTAPGDGAIGQHIGKVGCLVLVECTVGEHGVHQRFLPVLWDRERNCTPDRTLDAQAAISNLSVERIFLGGIASRIGQAEVAVTRIDIHAEGLGEFGKQRFLACRQLVSVLGLVFCRDAEQRFFAGIGVHRVLTDMGRVLNTRRCAQPFASEFRHAIFASSLFSTDAGQFCTQLFGFGSRHLGKCCTCHQQADGQRNHGQFCLHQSLLASKTERGSNQSRHRLHGTLIYPGSQTKQCVFCPPGWNCSIPPSSFHRLIRLGSDPRWAWKSLASCGAAGSLSQAGIAIKIIATSAYQQRLRDIFYH